MRRNNLRERVMGASIAWVVMQCVGRTLIANFLARNEMGFMQIFSERVFAVSSAIMLLFLLFYDVDF